MRGVVSGPGTARVRAAAAALKTLAPATSAVLSMGVAGGLTEALDRGTLILGSRVRLIEEDRRFAVAAPAAEEGLRERVGAALRSSDVAFQRGDILTVERPLMGRSEKGVAFARSGALVAQMEDSAWAEWARAMDIPFVSVRSVLDGMNDSLPAAVLSWDWRGPGWLRVARSVAGQPGLGLALWRLGRWRGTARRSLDRALEAVVPSWDGTSE